jgi:hypothetical protein
MINGIGLDMAWAVGCAMLVLLIALWFVFHPEMRTGVLGTIGLALLALAALSRISAAWHDADGHVSPLALFVWTGLAFYLSFIARNFWRRSTHRDQTWYSDGRKSRQ